MFRGYLPRNKIPYNFQPLSGFGAGGGLPIANKIFDLRQVTDDKMLDFTGQFVAPDGHDYRNAHLIGDGVTASYFYAGLDGETVYLYNIGTSSWVSQVYTHATGIVLGAGVEILEAYSDLGDVWTFEEKGCAALYNLKGTDHGYIDATGTALENFRSGRNFLSSQWKTSIRYKNNNAYGYSGSVGVTGAATGYRFTEPVPVDVDFTMTYGPLTSPIIYDYANTESDGSGDGYGFRINTDYTADFYRKDAGVITVLASATAGDYEGGIRVVMNYNIPNDKFTLKAYELGAVNPSDTDNVVDPTHAYPENDYQRFEFPNGNESVSLITDGTVEDLNLWTISGTVCVAYIPGAFEFDASIPPVITGFITDDVGNRLDALGGRLEFVGAAKLNASFIGSNAFQSNGTDNSLNTNVIVEESEDWKWRFKAKFNLAIDGRMGARDANFFYFGLRSGNWVLYYKNQFIESTVPADSNWNNFEITGNGKVYVNGIMVIDASAVVGSLPSIPIWLFATNFNSVISTPVDIMIVYSEFENNGSIIKRIVASAGIGDQLYDTAGNKYQIEGTINEGTQWVKQDEYHYNIVNSFDAYENTLGERLFVPIGSTVTQSGYAKLQTFNQDGKSLLPCETDISFPQAPALIQADVDNVLFDVSGNPREIDWEDVINAAAEQTVIGIESTVGNDGQGQAVVSGLTVQSIIVNGEITDGTGWSPGGGVLSVIDNQLKLTGNGSLSTPNVLGGYPGYSIPSGTKITASCFVKVPVGCTKVELRHRDTTSLIDQEVDFISSPAVGSYLFLGGQYILATDSDFARWQVVYRFATAAETNGLEMFSKMLIGVNQTTNGQLSDKGEDQMLALVQTMVAGTDLQHLKNPDVTSTHSDTIQKSIMSIRGTGGADWIGRSLPNGVSDLSYTYFKKNVQNAKSYFLDVGDVGGLVTSTTNIDIVLINHKSDDVGVSGNGKSYSTNLTEPLVYADSTDNEWTHYASAAWFSIVVPKGTYATQAEAEADLISKNLEIVYQLATPIITDAEITIIDENGVSQDYWHLYANGQISGEAEDLLPIVRYKNLQHGDQIMADTHYGYKKQRLIGYSEAQTGYALQQIYRALNK